MSGTIFNNVKGEAAHAPSPLPRAQKAFGHRDKQLSGVGAERHKRNVKGEADHAPSPLPRAQKAFGHRDKQLSGVGAERHKQ